VFRERLRRRLKPLPQLFKGGLTLRTRLGCLTQAGVHFGHALGLLPDFGQFLGHGRHTTAVLVRAIGQLTDQLEGVVEGEESAVAVVAQAQAVGALGAGTVLGLQFQAGEDSVGRPHVMRHDGNPPSVAFRIRTPYPGS